MDVNSKLTRRGFVALTGAASLSALLAACGGGEEHRGAGGARPSPPSPLAPRSRASAEPAPAEPAEPAAPAAPTFDPASEPDGPIELLRVGRLRRHGAVDVADVHRRRVQRREPAEVHVPRERHPGARQGGIGLQPGRHPSLHRVLAGLPGGRPDPAVRHGAAARLRGHPRGHPVGRRRRGDGLTYHVPFDIGFSSLVYRADKIPITPEEESWSLLLDDAYEGRSRPTPTR